MSLVASLFIIPAALFIKSGAAATTVEVITSYAPLRLCYSFVDVVKSATYYACSPARWIWHAITWILSHIAVMFHTLYPILFYLLIVVGCGALIGGCAGFAVEAFSAMLLSATWGSDKSKTRRQGADDNDDATMEKNDDEAERRRQSEEEDEEAETDQRDVQHFQLRNVERKSSVSTADADYEWTWHSEDDEDPKAYIERTLLRKRQHRSRTAS